MWLYKLMTRVSIHFACMQVYEWKESRHTSHANSQWGKHTHALEQAFKPDSLQNGWMKIKLQNDKNDFLISMCTDKVKIMKPRRKQLLSVSGFIFENTCEQTNSKCIKYNMLVAVIFCFFPYVFFHPSIF